MHFTFMDGIQKNMSRNLRKKIEKRLNEKQHIHLDKNSFRTPIKIAKSFVYLIVCVINSPKPNKNYY